MEAVQKVQGMSKQQQQKKKTKKTNPTTIVLAVSGEILCCVGL